VPDDLIKDGVLMNDQAVFHTHYRRQRKTAAARGGLSAGCGPLSASAVGKYGAIAPGFVKDSNMQKPLQQHGIRKGAGNQRWSCARIQANPGRCIFIKSPSLLHPVCGRHEPPTQALRMDHA
jgi:hypothetical protein